MRRVLILVCLCIQVAAFAQRNDVLKDSTAPLIDYTMLPDRGYSFQQVLNNGLPFISSDSLHAADASFYWFKIIITSRNRATGNYSLLVNPAIINTYYYFNWPAKKWLTHTAGIMVATDDDLTAKGTLPFILSPLATDTVYVKMDVRALKQFGSAIMPQIILQNQADVNRKEKVLWGGWIATIAVLFFFLLYNLYLYISLRDRSALYYLVAQLGSIIYITTYRGILGSVFSLNTFSFFVYPGGSLNYYSLDFLIMHIGIMLIMFGLVQLTRFYLETKKHFPLADKTLGYGLGAYIMVSVILIIINAGWFYIERYSILYDNVFLFLLAAVMLYVCIAGYMRKLRASGPFLLANLLPLVLMMSVTLFHIFFNTNTTEDTLLPNLAIVSQAFVFSVALVARTKSIQNDLKEKELENQKININIQYEKTNNELLRQTLEANQRELASNTLYLVQKNELLANLKYQLEELNRLYPKYQHNKLSGIESILQSNLHLDDDWNKFKLHFEQVHPHFFEDLQAKHPSLTKNEIRLCAYFHLNLSTKEIAALLNIAPDSVRKAKARLQKKMDHNDEEAGEDGLDQSP